MWCEFVEACFVLSYLVVCIFSDMCVSNLKFCCFMVLLHGMFFV